MSDFNESHLVNFDTSEISCRYLNIDLPLSLRKPSYGGKFGQELKKVGIYKLPFGITLSELILCGALEPSLYVALPEEYFESWKNFPNLPCQSDYDEGMLVGMYACQPMPQLATNAHELLHPYDGKLKSTFKKKFQTKIPKKFSICDHPSNGKYLPAEAYLPYWQVYALAANFHKYRYAESFLSSDIGKSKCLQLIKAASKSFIQKYGNVFDRISWYKTIIASITFGNLNVTNTQLLELTQIQENFTIDLLKDDLLLLLKLDADWNLILKQYGCTVLQNVRSSLSKDIYLVYKQLQLLGMPASLIFEHFTTNYSEISYTPLHDVLQSEGYEFKQSFIEFGSYYCDQMRKWDYACTEEVFDSLIQVPGFDTWIRAFHDLHKSINDTNKRPINFGQNRIIDALIVISVRTEIVLREMFRDELESTSDKGITHFLNSTKLKIKNDVTKILETCCNEIKDKTKLHKRPNNLFDDIDQFCPCGWSRKDTFFLQALLIFITARNYFAHHAYKDNELNIQTSLLSRKILESLLTTLLFFQKNKKTSEST